MLKVNCHKYGYNYIEIVNDIIGKNGIVNDEFLNSNHHLDNEKHTNYGFLN